VICSHIAPKIMRWHHVLTKKMDEEAKLTLKISKIWMKLPNLDENIVYEWM
jgi:hypothetical protein